MQEAFELSHNYGCPYGGRLAGLEPPRARLGPSLGKTLWLRSLIGSGRAWPRPAGFDEPSSRSRPLPSPSVTPSLERP
jgi:hypothetical protein